MIDAKFIDDMVKRFNAIIPLELQQFQKDLERNLRSILQGAFAKLDLVTREEFDAQKGVLAKTRSKVEALEKQIAKLEKQSLDKQGKKGSKSHH